MNLWTIIKGLLIREETDKTKELVLEVHSTASTGTRMTVTTKHNGNRTLTLPNATDTLVGKNTTDVLSNKDLRSTTNLLTGAKADNFERETGNEQVVTIPDTTVPDDIVLNDFAATLINKSMDGDDNTFTDIDISSLKVNLTDAGKFLVRDGAGTIISNTKDVPTGVVVGNTDTQTLTNKSIDSDNNTITNIVDADIKTLAGIDATKIGSGNVNNSEYETLDGVTSSIQNQLNAKLDDFSSTTDNALVRTDGTTGEAVQDSGIIIDDSDNITGVNDLTVGGDLTVNGTLTSINSTDLDVTDKNITVNKGGSDASSEGAGLTIERTATDGSIVYEDALTSKFKLGALGSEVEVVTVSGQQAITNKDIDGGTSSNTNRITLPGDTETNITGLTRKAGTVNYITDLELLALDTGSELKIIGEGDKVVIRGLVAGEALAQNDAVYVSDGSDGNTVSEVYKLDASDDTKMEYIGIIEEAVSAAAECVIVVAGKVANFSALTPGKNLYADYATPGDYTQTEPSQAATWSVLIGKAISVTEILVNPDLASSAIYIEQATGSFTIVNNQVAAANITNLLFDGSTYRAAFIDYSVYRRTDTGAEEAAQVGTLQVAYKTDDADWSLTDTFGGDDAGVEFTITSGGQIQYTSSSLAGSSYSGVLKFDVRKLLEV